MTVIQFPREKSVFFYQAAKYYFKLRKEIGRADAEAYLEYKVPKQLAKAVQDIILSVRSA